MVTQAEVEAASNAIVNANDELSPDTAAFLATLALEAAERVRPHKTSTERVHRHRARKRAARNVSGWEETLQGA